VEETFTKLAITIKGLGLGKVNKTWRRINSHFTTYNYLARFGGSSLFFSMKGSGGVRRLVLLMRVGRGSYNF